MSSLSAYLKAKRRKACNMKSGCRYERAIKQALNKFFDNHSVFNKHLASIIADYSHSSVLYPGSCMLTADRQFFVVTEVMSAHWCMGYFCPPRLEFMGHHGVVFMPNIFRRTASQKKTVFDPFGCPWVRTRSRSFHLNKQSSFNESLSNFPQIFI